MTKKIKIQDIPIDKEKLCASEYDIIKACDIERAKEILKDKLAIYNKNNLTSLRIFYDTTALQNGICTFWLELEFIVNGKYKTTRVSLSRAEYYEMESNILYSHTWQDCNNKAWWKEFVLDN